MDTRRNNDEQTNEGKKPRNQLTRYNNQATIHSSVRVLPFGHSYRNKCNQIMKDENWEQSKYTEDISVNQEARLYENGSRRHNNRKMNKRRQIKKSTAVIDVNLYLHRSVGLQQLRFKQVQLNLGG